MHVFIVEHMEEEMFEWCVNEYTNMIKNVEKVVFYNMPAEFINNPPPVFRNCEMYPYSVTTLPTTNICLLDSESVELLSPADKNEFTYFLLGGILGDVDENDFDKTAELRKFGYASRNLQNMQMTTDTALLVSDKILNGIEFKDLEFVDRPEIDLGDGESLIMNFRYLKDLEGKPLIADGIVDLLKEDNGFF